MNAFTRIIAGVITILTASSAFCQVSMTDLSTSNIVNEAKAKPKAEEHTYANNDVELGKKLASTIRAGERQEQCVLVTVVSSEQSYSRDLALFSRSDLAAGALVSADMVINEAGAISAIVGLNGHIELMEDNSVDVFGRRMYVSYAHKAAGKGIDEFTSNAAKAGFLVTSASSPCNSSARPQDLTKVAEQHLESLRKEAEHKAEIASR